MKQVLGVVGAALVLAAGARGAAPPLAGRPLTLEDERQVQRLEAARLAQLRQGRFEQAARLAGELLALRVRAQGPRHWQTADARLAAEDMRLLARVPARDRPDVPKAAGLNAKGVGFC